MGTTRKSLAMSKLHHCFTKGFFEIGFEKHVEQRIENGGAETEEE